MISFNDEDIEHVIEGSRLIGLIQKSVKSRVCDDWRDNQEAINYNSKKKVALFQKMNNVSTRAAEHCITF